MLLLDSIDSCYLPLITYSYLAEPLLFLQSRSASRILARVIRTHICRNTCGNTALGPIDMDRLG